MKLAIIVPFPFYYQLPLYRHLTDSKKIDLTVYYCSDKTLRVIDDQKNRTTEEQIEKNSLGGYNYKFLKNYFGFISFPPLTLMNFGIWGEIKKNRYDAVIIQAWNKLTWWLAFLACLRFKTPVLFLTDANSLSIPIRPSWKKWLKKYIFKNILFKKASGFLASSSVNKIFYKEYGVPEKKITELHYSYGYENFLEAAKQLKPQRDRIRKYFGINNSDFVFLFVGRLSAEKNIFTLINAYKRLGYKNKKLFIVGKGSLQQQIEEHVKNLNIQGIFLEGFQTRGKLFDFYACADAFVLPSTDEPWGMVVNEAMCFSLPIIASDKAGAAVDLVKDGYNGFIFPAEDTGKLFKCVQRLINLSVQERQNFGSRSLEIVTKWTKEIDPIKQIFKMMEIIKEA